MIKTLLIIFFTLALSSLITIHSFEAYEDNLKALEHTDNKIINNSNLIYDLDSHPFGITYSDWTAKWWQWTYSIPWNINPSYDDVGKYCNVNQNGPVWFLTLAFDHPVIRKCEIPKNTAILITLLNSECSYAENKSLKTEGQLRECAKKTQDYVSGAIVSLDGINIPNASKYRIQTNLFNFTLPKNNILNLTSQTTQAIADGNWLFLKPLKSGIHELKVKGTINSTNPLATSNGNQYAGPIGWNETTTYILNVK